MEAPNCFVEGVEKVVFLFNGFRTILFGYLLRNELPSLKPLVYFLGQNRPRFNRFM